MTCPNCTSASESTSPPTTGRLIGTPAARIVVDAGGVIRDIEAHSDYTHRPEPKATLDVLRALA